jgi:hypothetical protein
MLLQTELVEQCKHVLEVMAQNAKLMAALSKGGGGGDGGGRGSGKGGGGNNGGRHKTPWKEKKLCPNCKSTIPQSVSPSKRTRTNASRDGAPNMGNDRDRGPRIMMQY